MRGRADGRRGGLPAPPVRSRSASLGRRAAILDLQRTAGNASVANLLTGRVAVQRHQGIDPAASAHVMTATEEKDMPAVADAPALAGEQGDLIRERAALAAKIKKAGTAADPKDTQRVKDINTRLAELKKKLDLRVKGDEAETLARNTIKGGTKAWFADIKTITFLDRPATVHKLLAARLKQAEDALKGVPPPPNGWVQEGHSTLRPPGQSLHSFGLAIDLNPHTNPFLVEATGVYEPAAWSKSIKQVIDNATLLITGNKSADPFFAKPKAADKDARVEASYDKMLAASSAMTTYLKYADADKDATKKAELQQLVTALGANDPKKRTVDAWIKEIKADSKKLKQLAGLKNWTSPEKGFIDLDKRLVKAITSSSGAGLTWLGDETVGGRDVMHFDMRGAGPIKSIWKSAEGKATFLGG